MPTSIDSFSPASALESLPVELLLKAVSEVVLSSTRPDHKSGQFPHIPGTMRTREKIPVGIHAVSLTSRHLHNIANAVLYRTVVLDREKDVVLFGRTVNGARDASKAGRRGTVAITLAFLQGAVKRLAITYTPMHTDLACVFVPRKLSTEVSNSEISTIITACSGANTIAIHSQWALVLRDIKGTAECSKGGDALIVPTLTELLLSSYVDLAKRCCTIPPIAQWRPSAPSTPVHSLPVTPSDTRPSTPDLILRPDSALNCPSQTSIFKYITHLRIAEPAYAWYSPLALLKVFPLLTHIALPRRAHANKENDNLFIEDVKAILREPRMQVVIITIFPQIRVGGDREQAVDQDVGGLLDIKNSTIWLAAEELRKGDGRLFVVNARMGSWRQDWQGPGVVASAKGPENWWRKVTRI